MLRIFTSPKNALTNLILKNQTSSRSVVLYKPLHRIKSHYSEQAIASLTDNAATSKLDYQLNYHDKKFFSDYTDSLSREVAFFKMDDEALNNFSVYTFNHLFRILVKNPERHLAVAETLFSKLLNGKYQAKADSYTYSYMFKFYSQLRQPHGAEKLYLKLLKEGPDSLATNSLNNFLVVYEKSRVSIEKMIKILQDFADYNIKPDDFTFGILFRGCLAHKDLERAKFLLDEMKRRQLQPSIFCYNSYIKLLSSLNIPHLKVIEYFKTVVNSGVRPDEFTYSTLIRMCLNQAADFQAHLLLEEMIIFGFEPSINTIKLIGITPTDFLKMLLKNNVKASANLYNVLLDIAVNNNNFTEAFEITTSMYENSLTPSVHSYCILMSAYVKIGNYDKAFQLFEEMKDRNIVPDAHIYRTLVEAVGNRDGIQSALDLVNEARENGVRGNHYIYNTALGICAKNQDISASEKLLNMLKEDGQIPNTRIYNSLLSIYNPRDSFSYIWELFKEMKSNSVIPDNITYKLMLQHCCSQMDYHKACQIFNEMMQSQDSFPTSKNCVELLQLLVTQSKLSLAFETYFSYISSPWVTIKDDSLAMFLHLCQMRNRCKTALSVFEGFKSRIASRVLQPFTLHPATYILYLRLLVENNLFKDFFLAYFDAQELYSIQFNRGHLRLLKSYFEGKPQHQVQFAEIWSLLPEGNFSPEEVPAYIRLPFGLKPDVYDIDD